MHDAFPLLSVAVAPPNNLHQTLARQRRRDVRLVVAKAPEMEAIPSIKRSGFPVGQLEYDPLLIRHRTTYRANIPFALTA